MLSLQQIFDKGLDHIRKQGEACVSNGGGCCYRNLKGQACIIGGLFPDSAYDERLEDMGSITSSIMGKPDNLLMTVLKSGDIDVNANLVTWDLLCCMQGAHDGSAANEQHDGSEFMPAFEAKMEIVAKSFGLEMRVASSSD